jgi:hypothetical protein
MENWSIVVDPVCDLGKRVINNCSANAVKLSTVLPPLVKGGRGGFVVKY